MKLKHEGFSAHRLKHDNPREVAFIAEWLKENAEHHNRALLRHLIPDVTPRDAQVAATIVQWLGSNIGISFLREVLKREPDIKRQIGI